MKILQPRGAAGITFGQISFGNLAKMLPHSKFIIKGSLLELPFYYLKVKKKKKKTLCRKFYQIFKILKNFENLTILRIRAKIAYRTHFRAREKV